MSEANSDTPIKHTPLYELHAANGAKFGPFAGYEMPLFYPAGIITEHKHTREKAGLFDISHMMHVEVMGTDALKLIERLCPLDTSGQVAGQARYTFLLNENAGIIDDLIVTKLADDKFLMVCNAGCAEKDWEHINGNVGQLQVDVVRRPRGFIALQGPMAEAVLSNSTLAKAGVDFSSISFMSAIEADNVFVSRTGYTGEDGFEIAMDEGEIAQFVEALLADENVLLIGLGARDSLRLEAGLSLYGQDLNDETSPMEAGLTWAIAKPLREGGEFIGAQALAEKIAAGRSRKRIGLIAEGKAPVRAGAILKDGSGKQIGTVTSGGFGPSVDHPVALGLVSVDADENTLVAEVRNREIPMNVAKLPFVTQNYKH